MFVCRKSVCLSACDPSVSVVRLTTVVWGWWFELRLQVKIFWVFSLSLLGVVCGSGSPIGRRFSGLCHLPSKSPLPPLGFKFVDHRLHDNPSACPQRGRCMRARCRRRSSVTFSMASALLKNLTGPASLALWLIGSLAAASKVHPSNLFSS